MNALNKKLGGRKEYHSPEICESLHEVESGFCLSNTGEAYGNQGKVYESWGYTEGGK